MAVPGPAIVCEGLTKRYGRILALDDLRLEVPSGSVYGFLGPNGAGKTTTFRILGSLARASAGSASLAGLPVGDGAPNRAGMIGYLDQDPRFHTWMTGRELLNLVGHLYGLGGADLRSRVAEILELVGLSDAADRRIGGYSGGMRQRIGLAQAILNRPPVLLLDEPVSALDPEGRRDILEVIRTLGGSSTVLFSTHILNDVERVCDRVAILDHGRMVTSGPMEELLARYTRPIYLIEPEAMGDDRELLAERLRGVEGVTSVELLVSGLRVTVAGDDQVSARLLSALAATGMQIARFERQRPTLEDVFLQLVGREPREEAA